MYTVREFCELMKISRRHFDLLKAQGLGPTITRVGGRIMIAKDAAAEWLKMQERAAA
jgi:hypothetical protein